MDFINTELYSRDLSEVVRILDLNTRMKYCKELYEIGVIDKDEYKKCLDELITSLDSVKH